MYAIRSYYVIALKSTAVNRLSIGTQSFNNQDLKNMNRRHNGQQAIAAVRLAQETGFSNISIDLIYGLPSQTLDAWHENVQQAIQLRITSYNVCYTKLLRLRFEKNATSRSSNSICCASCASTASSRPSNRRIKSHFEYYDLKILTGISYNFV